MKAKPRPRGPLAHLEAQRERALHARGLRNQASCEEWPARGTVSAVIHPQEVSLAKVTGNHLKVAGGGARRGKLSKSLVYRVTLLETEGHSAETSASLSRLLCLYLLLLDKNGCETTYRTYLLVYFLVKVKHSTEFQGGRKSEATCVSKNELPFPVTSYSMLRMNFTQVGT